LEKAMSIPQLSNPFSTGGGGDQFEKSVGAYYLVALLAEDIPRGLRRGITKRVRFQQRYTGTILDDVVVTSEDANGQEFQLEIQIKHDLSFNRTNQLFRRVIDDCWQTFINSKERSFGPDRDKLGIAFGTQPPARIEHLQRALDWARTTTSVDDYFIKLGTSNLASKEMRYYVNDVFRSVLGDVAGYTLTDDEIFQFLRCLVILHFDLEHDGARDTTYVWNRLLDRLDGRDEAEARKLANRLFRLVVEYNKDASGFDHCTLRDKLASDFHLRESISCQQDLDRLRRHSDLVLDRIVTEIGGAVSLPRSQLLNDLWTHIEQVGSGVIVITGEPGTGKSVLMKVLVDHLRQENEVIATEFDRLRGPSLESFLEMLQIKQPLERLLSATSSGSFRCLFIDQLERVQGDEDHHRVLDDFILVIRRFNDQVLANGGHTDSCWRIVLTCRKEEFANSVRNTVLTEYAQTDSLREFEVGDLTEEEFRAVIEQFPRLNYLSNYERANFLLKRAFYLNLLAKRQNRLDEANLPEQFTETWFLKFFWEDVVCQEQFHHEREQVLLHIVKNRLVKGTPFTSITDLNSLALNSLISDQIVIREEMGVRLAHDIFEDWVGERLIASTGDQLAVLREQIAHPINLLRPIELRALYHLEVNYKAEAWLTLTSLESRDKLPPSWRDAAVGAIFKSERLAELLELAKPLLLAKDSTLLLQVLRIMRTVYTEPSAAMRTLIVGIPKSASKKEMFLASSRDPIISLWEPVLRFVLDNQYKMPLTVLPELSQVCEMWLKTFIAPVRPEVALLCYRYLSQTFDQPLDDLADWDNEEIRFYSDIGTISGQTRRTLTIALLSAADCVPDTVEAFVRHELRTTFSRCKLDLCRPTFAGAIA
jgi:hypothetical protein